MTKTRMQMFKKLFKNFFKLSAKSYQLKANAKGFTLLELLIVIAILATLATIVVLVLNPAETLAKSRDTQRMSDLQTLKAAIALYATTVAPIYLGGASSNTACKSAASWAAGQKIFYSVDSSGSYTITDTLLDGSIVASQPAAGQVTATNLALTSGSGWVPVNLDGVTGGSPISNLPVDPTNTVTVGNVNSNDLVYRYACYVSGAIRAFEIDAALESTAYTVTDNIRIKDGGNDANYLEIGTKLDILGAGTDDF